MQSNQCHHGQIETLREQIARLEGAAPRGGGEAVSSGFAGLDRLLPEGGFRPGTLVEWLAASPGAGTATLALSSAAVAAREGGGIVVLDPTGEFYPPAAVHLGIDPRTLIVVHVAAKTDVTKGDSPIWVERKLGRSPADYLWALDQSLRCPAVAAVVAWPQLDGRTFRRLQLAVEAGGGLGIFLRPASVRGEPSWADVRLLVEPLPTLAGSRRRRVRIIVLRCRGTLRHHEVEVEVDDAAHPMSMG